MNITNVDIEDLPYTYCLGDSRDNSMFPDRGCGEDLRQCILDGWDGTRKPFLIKCNCGRVHEIVCNVLVDVDSIYLRGKRP